MVNDTTRERPGGLGAWPAMLDTASAQAEWMRLALAMLDGSRSALEFQRTVDRLFSFGGFRGDEEDSPIRLARRFRELAGFDDQEIDEIAALSTEARSMMEERIAAASTLADTGS